MQINGASGPVFLWQRVAMTAPIWRTSRFAIDLSRPQVMGIVNLTPDSFSDGGAHASISSAIRHSEALVAQGADILDLGAESTRPGSPPVPLALELERLLPVLREVLRLGVPVSVDSYKAEVMRVALDLGADIVNDIWALRHPGSLAVIAQHPTCGVCLMHMHRDPQTMQSVPMEGDVPAEVRRFLAERAQALRALQVDATRIVLDPGIGFGKTVAQNFQLLAHQRDLLGEGYPLLAGWSRKSSLGAVTNIEHAAERMVPSVAAALLAADRGAAILRVHDVRETVAALAVRGAVLAAERQDHNELKTP